MIPKYFKISDASIFILFTLAILTMGIMSAFELCGDQKLN